jgi:hypothetical protein
MTVRCPIPAVSSPRPKDSVGGGVSDRICLETAVGHMRAWRYGHVGPESP